MQAFVPLVYDIATIVVFVYMIGVCAHRGFVRTIVSFLGYAAALVGSAALSKPLSQWVYDSILRPSVVNGISEKLSQVGGELLPENLMELVESLPEILTSSIGLDKQQLVNTLQDILSGGGADAAGAIADAVVAPLALLLLKLVFFLLVFGVAMFFVRKLCWVFGGVNSIPLIGPVNRVLGGVVGAAQAALTLFVFAWVLGVLVSFTGGGLTVQPSGQPALMLAGEDVFQRTLFFKVFMHFNPLDLLLLQNGAAIPPTIHNGAQFL